MLSNQQGGSGPATIHKMNIINYNTIQCSYSTIEIQHFHYIQEFKINVFDGHLTIAVHEYD